MKTLPYILALLIAFASCNFGAEDDPTTKPVITEPADSTIPTKVDNTDMSEPDEIPVAQLPADAKSQAIESMDIVVTTTPGMKVEDLETFLLICNDEVVKDAKCFTMTYMETAPNTDGFTTVKLNGRPYYYQQTFNGQTTAMLGYLKLGNKWYQIDAEDKDPTWIYPYLATMQPKAAL